MIDQTITDAEVIEDSGTAAVAVASPAASAVARRDEPVDGAWLLNLSDAWIGQHCYLTDAARHTLALWTLAQHFRTPKTGSAADGGHLTWDKFGHLLFVAETPGSGKTTAMKVAGYLCAPWFFGIDNNPTAPGLCMTIAQEHAVVCIDEAHRLIGSKGTRKADVVTIICASFEQDGSYLNGRGGKANRVPVYAPMMIAAKKDPFLTSAGEEIADVVDRSVLIMMSKPPAGGDGPALRPVTGETRVMGAQIAARAAAWAAQQMADPDRMRAASEAARVAAARTGLAGRDADVWLAMFTVAALASPGHLEVACQVAAELRLNRPVAVDEQADPLRELEASLTAEGAYVPWGAPEAEPAPVAAAVPSAATTAPVAADPGILRDVALAWRDGERKVTSAELVRRLWNVTSPEDVPAAQRELAAALKPHGIESAKIRLQGDARTYWGYLRAQFPAMGVPVAA